MANAAKKGGLGRGLGSLIGESLEEINVSEVAEEEAETKETPGQKEKDDPKPGNHKVYVEEDDHVEIKGVTQRAAKIDGEVDIASIIPNPDQPRIQFKPEEIEELANSIEREGLLQPILVRKKGEQYQIIAGERRFQACKSLGMKTVPVRIMEANDEKILELALIENIQRSDLNPIEEAYGYKRLIERRGMTQAQVAEVVSKGRSTVANALRLLELPEEAQRMLYEEKITAGHARAILSVPTEEGRIQLTERLAKEKLSVRETEDLARELSGEKKERKPRTKEPVPDSFKRVARDLKKKLQTNVRVKSSGGKNRIEIEFKDEAELKRLVKALTK